MTPGVTLNGYRRYGDGSDQTVIISSVCFAPIAGTSTIDAGGGIDTLELSPSTGTLTLSPATLSNFEILIKDGAGDVHQNGELKIAVSGTGTSSDPYETTAVGKEVTFTISSGAYVLNADATLRTQDISLEGGSLELRPAGSSAESNAEVLLYGNSIFKWTGGEVSHTFTSSDGMPVIDATDGSGRDKLDLAPTTGAALSFTGEWFVGFELLSVSGAGTVTQTGTLDLATTLNSGTEISVTGGTYELGSVER